MSGRSRRLARRVRRERPRRHPPRLRLSRSSVRCSHVSTHVALDRATELATTERILEVIRLTHEAVRRLRPQARIAVAGINPHAGEHGAFGTEDDAQIRPAVEQARREGVAVSGPEPGDTG